MIFIVYTQVLCTQVKVILVFFYAWSRWEWNPSLMPGPLAFQGSHVQSVPTMARYIFSLYGVDIDAE